MLKQKLLILSFILLLACLCIVKFPVKAAAISPDKYYIDVTDTTPVDETLTIYGQQITTKQSTFNVSVVGIKKLGEGNDREFYLPNADDSSEPANWIKLSQNQISIAPNEQKTYEWTLEPSDNLKCGTYYAGIVLSEDTIGKDLQNNLVNVSSQVISQVHINVINKQGSDNCSGKTNLSLVSFNVNSVIPVFNYDNIPFVTRIQNNSSYIARNPMGYIELFGIGSKITIPFNNKSLDIYPSSIRRFDDTWTDSNYPTDNFISQIIYEIRNFHIGLYQARLGITKNVDNDVIATTTVLILPWRILLILLLIIGFIFLVVRNYFKTQKELKLLKKKLKS